MSKNTFKKAFPVILRKSCLPNLMFIEFHYNARTTKGKFYRFYT